MSIGGSCERNQSPPAAAARAQDDKDSVSSLYRRPQRQPSGSRFGREIDVGQCGGSVKTGAAWAVTGGLFG